MSSFIDLTEFPSPDRQSHVAPFMRRKMDSLEVNQGTNWSGGGPIDRRRQVCLDNFIAIERPGILNMYVHVE
jgi:hypothetical protein